MRNKIKRFAQNTVKRVKGVPNFKLLILDEADSLTHDAQAALRRTLENYSHITRICFICNYVSRIIEPLASRCAKFRFRPLDKESLTDRIKVRLCCCAAAFAWDVCVCLYLYLESVSSVSSVSSVFAAQLVASKENVSVTTEVVDTLQTVSGGDLRRAITLLQSASKLYGDEPLTEESILEVAGAMPADLVEQVGQSWHHKDLSEVLSAVRAHRCSSAFTDTHVIPCTLLDTRCVAPGSFAVLSSALFAPVGRQSACPVPGTPCQRC